MKDHCNPLSINQLGKSWNPVGRSLLSLASPLIDRLFCLKQMGEMYLDIVDGKQSYGSTIEFIEILHERLDIRCQVAEEALARVPQNGPLIVVANHPFGGIEATILLRLLSKRRQDIKFMANFLLGSLPECRDFCIYVDPFGGKEAARKNLQPLRDSIDFVQQGGTLCVFPSGTVSHFHWQGREVTDPKWSPMVGRIVRKTGAPVVPIFFPGSNGLFFQAAGVIHPLLRTSLLIREFYNKRHSDIRMRVGNLIPSEKLVRFASDEELITYLRLRTYILGNEKADPKQVVVQQPPVRKFFTARSESCKLERIVPPVDNESMTAEIGRLSAEHLLVESDGNAVYYARAKQIPNVLREIGRLREISFREVNEGTGRSLDVDHFDNYYIHLFIWNRAKQEVVGAYRLAKTDRVFRRFGRNGLYTSTLFAYRSPLLQQMGPALELGRSFVRKEYQRNFTPLLLLWRGIGNYVLRNPRYKVLFGPVSINNEYDTVSRGLITTFLRANNYLPELARLIKARNPMAPAKVKGMDIETTSFVVKDLKDVSDLLQDVESQQKTVPILLRQYLKLGGKLLGFNVDSNFGDVLDGLIFVDLTETDLKLLERYMGRDGAQEFLAFHGKLPSTERRTGTSDRVD
jgi:putative hemolysin